jgi:hypothetical protein
VVLAAVALWLITNYAPVRLAMGLLTVAAFALSGIVQYQLGRRWGRPIFWVKTCQESLHCKYGVEGPYELTSAAPGSFHLTYRIRAAYCSESPGGMFPAFPSRKGA